MEFFLNELSLHNQFADRSAFLSSLEVVLQCRKEINHYRYRLYCGKESLSNRIVYEGISFTQAIVTSSNTNLKQIVMSWISKEGPFWDDDSREHTSDDYLEYEGEPIFTDSSLGEAAFRIMKGKKCYSISFWPSNFEFTPIHAWYKNNETHQVKIPNFWDFSTLQPYLKTQQAPPQSWPNLLTRFKTDFPHLTFLDSLMYGLEGVPFNSVIADSALKLLSILNELKVCFDEQGNRTERGHEIIQSFFHGDNALFSDESNSNKVAFGKELTFKNPNGEPLFCPYHGKIRHGVFRIHFSWPIRHKELLYIAYIGPKITKH